MRKSPVVDFGVCSCSVAPKLQMKNDGASYYYFGISCKKTKFIKGNKVEGTENFIVMCFMDDRENFEHLAEMKLQKGDYITVSAWMERKKKSIPGTVDETYDDTFFLLKSVEHVLPEAERIKLRGESSATTRKDLSAFRA